MMPTMKKLRDAAAATGLSYSYLRRLCMQGKIVCVRAGSRWFVNMERLADYLNKGDVT